MQPSRNVAGIPHLRVPSCHSDANLQALRNATSVKALAPRHALARGVQAFGDMRRMRRFVGKLLTGENVTISVAGGSVSRGYGDSFDIVWESQGCGLV